MSISYFLNNRRGYIYQKLHHNFRMSLKYTFSMKELRTSATWNFTIWKMQIIYICFGLKWVSLNALRDKAVLWMCHYRKNVRMLKPIIYWVALLSFTLYDETDFEESPFLIHSALWHIRWTPLLLHPCMLFCLSRIPQFQSHLSLCDDF